MATVGKKSEYVIREGSFHEKFWVSRSKIQFIGGAFANGKTTAIVMKCLMVARDYPGCRICLGRSTKVKLRTTLQREFFKWCPKSWIKRYNKTEGELELTNGSCVDFRYISQKGTDEGESTSNLLSANYDLIAIDQVEDPELQEKDFDDLMGRLRGDTEYQGDDPTMPADGPRWFLLTANPTGNWVYHKFVRPMYDYRAGIENKDLIVDEETGVPLIELFEGSTYDNAHNLKSDFIKGLESTYRGQMRDRYLLGKWASYEGLVYPMVDEQIHFVDHEQIMRYVQRMRETKYNLRWLEAYDHGLHSPTCYLLGLVDDEGNILWIDGFYKPEHTIAASAQLIKMIRLMHGVPDDNPIYADPAIFRRGGTSDSRVVGSTVANLYQQDFGIQMTRGNNDIANGIVKVQGYLHQHKYHQSPFTGKAGAPFMYFSRKLTFVHKEIFSYHWKRQKSSGEIVDEPMDKNDHAMDAIKYATGVRPSPSELVTNKLSILPNAFMWYAVESKQNEPHKKEHRYG